MNSVIFSILLIVVGIFLGVVINNIISNIRLKNAKVEAEKIIDNAKLEAEKSKRDSIMEAKEEVSNNDDIISDENGADLQATNDNVNINIPTTTIIDDEPSLIKAEKTED